MQQLRALAEKIGGNVVPGGDVHRFDGLVAGVKEALSSGSVKADVAVTSDVKVKLEPTPHFWATIDARIEAKSKSSSGGISLPGKEMPKTYGGGGGGGGAQ